MLKYEELYRNLEIDIPETMERFMNNEDLLIKYLKKFTENTQFAELHQAIDDEQWENALLISHNLKSFTGNLSLTSLHKLLSYQVAEFRESRYDKAIALMTNIDAEREKILSILAEADI